MEPFNRSVSGKLGDGIGSGSERTNSSEGRQIAPQNASSGITELASASMPQEQQYLQTQQRITNDTDRVSSFLTPSVTSTELARLGLLGRLLGGPLVGSSTPLARPLIQHNQNFGLDNVSLARQVMEARNQARQGAILRSLLLSGAHNAALLNLPPPTPSLDLQSLLAASAGTGIHSLAAVAALSNTYNNPLASIAASTAPDILSSLADSGISISLPSPTVDPPSAPAGSRSSGTHIAVAQEQPRPTETVSLQKEERKIQAAPKIAHQERDAPQDLPQTEKAKSSKVSTDTTTTTSGTSPAPFPDYRELEERLKQSESAAGLPTVSENFPSKLHRLLSDLEKVPGGTDIASFLPDGNSFWIVHPSKFETDVMKSYFPRMGSFASFQRQLNLYCFQRVPSGPSKGAYFHPFFIKSFPLLCRSMKRTKIKGGKKIENGDSSMSSKPTMPK